MRMLLGTLAAMVIGAATYPAFAEQDASSSSDTQQSAPRSSGQTAPSSQNKPPARGTDHDDSGDEPADPNEGSSGDSGLNIQ